MSVEELEMGQTSERDNFKDTNEKQEILKKERKFKLKNPFL